MGNLLAQLPILEQKIEQVRLAVNDNRAGFRHLGALVERHVILIQAVTELLGTDAVQKKVDELEMKAFTAGTDAEIANAEAGVADGTVAIALQVTNDSDLVVIGVKNADGSPAVPSRNAAVLAKYLPSMREKLLGAKVGAEFTEGELTVTVEKVYTLVKSGS